jgi:hypothetical protein
VVYDSLIDDDGSKNALGLLISLTMLIEPPGEFDYTGADCTGWMQGRKPASAKPAWNIWLARTPWRSESNSYFCCCAGVATFKFTSTVITPSVWSFEPA